MNDCGCDGLAGKCTFPNCLPEADQQALANEVYNELYGPKVTPIRRERLAVNYDGGMSPSDRLIDAVIIVVILVIIFGFML